MSGSVYQLVSSDETSIVYRKYEIKNTVVINQISPSFLELEAQKGKRLFALVNDSSTVVLPHGNTDPEQTQNIYVILEAFKKLPLDTQRKVSVKITHLLNPNRPVVSEPSEYKDRETEVEDLKCIVCTVNKKCVIFEKCRHLKVCFSCSTQLNGKCPWCRQENQKTTIADI